MIIAGVYSFKQGQEVIEAQYASDLEEIMQIVATVDSSKHRSKKSKEKTMPGRMLYSPVSLNKAFAQEFVMRGWEKHRVSVDYSTKHYTPDYAPPDNLISGRSYREMDFVKNGVGVELQFGKYAFMVYNVAAKMTIFHNLGIIQVGIEIVPVKELADQMSTGVSYFEQFVWDLENRGIADIDIPVLILGIR